LFYDVQEWLAHPEPDAYWDTHNPRAEQYAALEIPILTVTGQYDDDQPGALEHYREHIRNASPTARANHYLVIGPWDHAGTGTPSADVGGLKVGASSLIDMPQLHLDWYAWTMANGSRPDFLKRPVVYYITAADEWRSAETLEEITERHETYFLDSAGCASDVFSAGSLVFAQGNGGPDSYTYDPRNTRGTEVEAEACAHGGSLTDQSQIFALHGRLLVYHSAPFDADTELSGFFRLCAWISIDCPDTDFYVSVHEIDLAGRSLRLTTDAIRARYREGPRTPKLIDTQEPLRYDFDRFTFVARQVRRGHRLRLVIAPVGRLVEGTFVQKNYNSGGVVSAESVNEARPVRVTLFHDAQYPSALYVPIGRLDVPDALTVSVSPSKSDRG
jgi:uncharacterized protein